MAYLVVLGSVIALTAYSWLLGTVPASKVATYAYVNPVVAVVLGGELHLGGVDPSPCEFALNFDNR